MFTHNSVIYYLILCSFYKHVRICKPRTSRNCNSERYLVCYSFHGISESNIHLIIDIRNIISQFSTKLDDYTIVFPNVLEKMKIENTEIYNILIKRLSYFNNIVIRKQVCTINDSIAMIHGDNMYIKDLLLRLFLKKISLCSIFLYKNILYSRINKSIEWLKEHNIELSKHFYYG